MNAAVTVATANTSGAVAIIQIHGADAATLLFRVTGAADWPLGRVRLRGFANTDEGLAVLLSDTCAQLMAHGGPRVVQKLVDHLLSLGAHYEPAPRPRELYPEAASDLEADMLATLAKAASPAAINLLLAQPTLWARWEHQPTEPAEDIVHRSDRLDRLVTPPAVVVIGRPNVGKSTLANRVLGRTASLVADLPGTTRDWVAGLADLSGVTVRWLDTPGLRPSDDPIEQRAIELARRVVADADVLIALRDPEIDWPSPADLPREPELWVINKCDRGGHATGPTLHISAATGEGVDLLRDQVLRCLGLVDLTPRLWAFTPALRQRLSG